MEVKALHREFDVLQKKLMDEHGVNFENTLLQISRISEEASEARYVGRIINPDAVDGYELKKDNQNNYSIEKFEISSLLQDCHSH
jgi:hypothetical protein